MVTTVAVVKSETIPLEQLLLDEENPRYLPTHSQPEARAALFGDKEAKLVDLARDIVKHGVSPIDALIVIPRGKNYTVDANGT